MEKVWEMNARNKVIQNEAIKRFQSFRNRSYDFVIIGLGKGNR